MMEAETGVIHFEDRERGHKPRRPLEAVKKAGRQMLTQGLQKELALLILLL